MPRRHDIHHVLVIGSGPIVIGQACEFDYSGTQACSVLRSEGLRVTLVNSNPATIMTDPSYADATYIEPITVDIVRKILQDQRERGFPIDSVLATLGGQTALNTAVGLYEQGVLEEFNITLIGADFAAISRGEDRATFKEIVAAAGGESARSAICYTLEEAYRIVEELGYPVVVRPSFTMGGLGSGIAYNPTDLQRIAGSGLAASPTANVLIEESILGWKEYELELMRDRNDNIVVVCSIENIDPVGVHTGDSITVAPAMTLTDREYQKLRDLSIEILRRVGVDTGGCNIQFAVDPDTGRIVVIEMNPRVSRSSALASKATGFPIAKIAAKLAIGYTLDEIINDITGKTPACFEPTLDYIVIKAPRFAFEKFTSADARLTTTMKSVGETMSLGRSFAESMGKVLRSLDNKPPTVSPELTAEELVTLSKQPTAERIFYVIAALERGANIDELYAATRIDTWFLGEIQSYVTAQQELAKAAELDARTLQRAKSFGLSDETIARIRGLTAQAVYDLRLHENVHPVYKTVDTCAAEFEAQTPYHYSAYELDVQASTEVAPSHPVREKIMILGSGPNRIGQGIEFDYSCVHAAKTLSAVGYETIMVNCNPETVSTDYDTADRLYFEPLTFEDVCEIYHAESATGPVVGVIVQLGGQTPLSLAQKLKDAGLPIIGTSPENINRAEDRYEFGVVLERTNLRAPEYGTVFTAQEALAIAERTGYPVLVRPSYVLGGRGMEIIYDDAALGDYITRATSLLSDHPILVDKFLEDAIEIDVDALCDGTEVYCAAVMEHIEEAGIHSGDSACVLPPITLSKSTIDTIISSTTKLAFELDVKGLINVQYALKDNELYVLEANPRASRTVPFVAKATGVAIAAAYARIVTGTSIEQLRQEGILPKVNPDFSAPWSLVAVKEAVLPFKRFLTESGTVVDSLLGPEMKSTGEVMGIDTNFPQAFAKSQIAACGSLPQSGVVIISVADKFKSHIIPIARDFAQAGFEILATAGTAQLLLGANIPCREVHKHTSNQRPEGEPSVVDIISSGEADIVINLPSDRLGARVDGYEIRAAASFKDTICITTIAAAGALISAIKALKLAPLSVQALQNYPRNFSGGRS